MFKEFKQFRPTNTEFNNVSRPSAEQFTPHRRQLVYKLNMSDRDIMKYSLGGFIIGNKGARIQGFLSPINEQNLTPTGEQFIRLRGLGKFYHAKAKKNGQDLWKRTGEARFEITFAIYDSRSKAKVVKYAREFEKVLEDAFKYYAWIQHKESTGTMEPDSSRNNLDLQAEYLDNKDAIAEQFKSGEIKEIRKMFTIEEKDLRPSIEQTPYMQKCGIPEPMMEDKENIKPKRQVNDVPEFMFSGMRTGTMFSRCY